MTFKFGHLTYFFLSRQETGIGKTVNLCRKYDGEVGELAQELYEKWKTVVAAVSSESDNDHKGIISKLYFHNLT